MDKAIKIFRNPLFMIIAGAVFGILAKYGDIAYANSIFSFFGLLTSGFAIWLVIGTAIIYISSSRKQLSVLLSSFMLPMLLAYYIFSVLAVKYFNIKNRAVLVRGFCVFARNRKHHFSEAAHPSVYGAVHSRVGGFCYGRRDNDKRS